MATIEKDLVAYRAKQLAIVLLTRREDLTVTTCSQDAALDLMVKLASPKSEENRCFAVVTEGYVSGRNGKRINSSEHLYPIPQQLSDLKNVSFPVCLFVFDMREDTGSWRWLLEPVADETGKHLRTNNDLTLAPLTNATVNAIVESVNCWHDAD